MKFERRTEPPSKDNKYYLHTPKGYNECIRISGDECIPNCTGYAYGRYMEAQNKKKCSLPTSNAENWYHDYEGKKGHIVKIGSIVCWKQGKIHFKKDGSGHVGFVEYVYIDGSFDTTESAYGGKRWYTKHYNANGTKIGYQLEGFIYPEVEFEPIKWEEGYYRLLNDKYLRKTPEVKSSNKIKVSECSDEIKPQLEYQTGYARFDIGQDVYLTTFKNDKKGNKWGKVKGNKVTTWICVLDKSGEQVERIDL